MAAPTTLRPASPRRTLASTVTFPNPKVVPSAPTIRYPTWLAGPSCCGTASHVTTTAIDSHSAARLTAGRHVPWSAIVPGAWDDQPAMVAIRLRDGANGGVAIA